MRNIIRLLLLGFVLAALSPGTWASPVAKPPPDYFPLRVGYWWTYKATFGDKTMDYKQTVISADKASDGLLYLMETTMPTQTIHDWYSKSNEWVLMNKTAYPKNNMSADYTPIKQYLENPLSTGATWDWSGKGMMGVDIHESNTVKGSEVVVVPAGKFSCQRVETDVVQGGQKVHKTYWFANWVGLIKSTTESATMKSTAELQDYSFRPKH